MARRRFIRAMMPPPSEEEVDDTPTGQPSVDGKDDDGSSHGDAPWTDEDVITLLRTMIDFIRRMEKDPLAHIHEFLPFMDMRTSFPISMSHLLSKIIALRLDYHINIAKGHNLSLDPFESEVFRLSRMIWGAPDAANKKLEGPDCPLLLHELVKLCKEAGLGFSEGYLRARIAKVDEEKVMSLEKRWKKQKLEEASIRARKAALEHQILEALMR